MKCDEVLRRIDGWVSGELPAAEAAELMSHTAACTTCRAELDSVTRLVETARGLPAEIEPQHDLWPEIARRIDAQRVVAGRFGTLGRLYRNGLVAAAVAAALVVVAGAAYWLGRYQAEPHTAAATRPGPVDLAGFENASAAGVRAELERARQELLAALARRQGSLSPETMTVVTDNVAVIDAAIARIASALQAEPDNPRLGRQLAFAYRQQIDLLRRATHLPAEV